MKEPQYTVSTASWPRPRVCGAAAVLLALLANCAVAQEHSAPRPPATSVPATLPQTPPATAQPGANVPRPTVVLEPGEVPAITFADPVWNFGRVKAGDDISHDFVFTNTGTGPLEILRVSPG